MQFAVIKGWLFITIIHETDTRYTELSLLTKIKKLK